MSDISLGQSARLFRLQGKNARAKAKLRHLPARREGDRPALARADATEKLRFVTMEREYASCFVDFLLGRGSRPPK
jgi:hypothetical protein